MREELMLSKLRARDPAALEALMDQYTPYVSAVAWGILKNAMSPQDAEEVVSDVFLAAWEQAEKIQPGSVKAWLAAVARNKSRHKLRKLGRDLPLEEDVLELPDCDTPDSRLERAEERRLVRKAVDTLGDPDREIFLRHYFYIQSVEDISRELDLNESTVKSKLRRGRMRLRAVLLRWGVA